MGTDRTVEIRTFRQIRGSSSIFGLARLVRNNHGANRRAPSSIASQSIRTSGLTATATTGGKRT